MPVEFEKQYHVDGNDCWNWLKGKTNGGYGLYWDGEKSVMAHRFSYENNVGPIPVNFWIDHLCRNRCCVNPKHLEPVPPRENTRRGIVIKLSLSDVEEIKKKRREFRAKEIAKMYGVSTSYVYKVWNPTPTISLSL